MKTIFISGASRGIGLELGKQLLARGEKVIAGCRNPIKATQLSKLQKSYPLLEVVPLDVDDPKSVMNCFARLEREGKKIDSLFNNAGIIDWRDLHNIDSNAFSKVLKTNLVGAFLVLHYALPCIEESPDPWVYNLSSRLGSIELRGNTQLGGAIAYQCSKAGLNMLTKQAAIDLAQKAINVVSISPGWVRTDMGGVNAKYGVVESVNKILKLINDLKPEHTGGFWGEDGKQIPW